MTILWFKWAMKIVDKYFECFKMAGFDTEFRIARFQDLSKIEELTFDHCEYDGVSAVVEMIRRNSNDQFKSPALKLPKPQNIFLRIWELIRWYIKFYPFTPTEFRNQGHYSKEMISCYKKLDNWNDKKSKYSLNARLLLSLDMASREFLKNKNGKTVWMNPVGLYEEIPFNLPKGNRVSFIDLKIAKDTKIDELALALKDELTRKSYWGTFLTTYQAIIFGKRLFSLFCRYVHIVFRRTGAYSNLGEWSIPLIDEKEWWVFSKGFAAKMSPVEAVSIIINNKLALSLHFHPCLGFNEELANQLLSNWIKYFNEISD